MLMDMPVKGVFTRLFIQCVLIVGLAMMAVICSCLFPAENLVYLDFMLCHQMRYGFV